MSLQAYSVPEQTDGRRKVSLEWKSIDVSYVLSITYGDTVNYYKSVHHLFLRVKIENILAIFKINQ